MSLRLEHRQVLAEAKKPRKSGREVLEMAHRRRARLDSGGIGQAARGVPYKKASVELFS